MRNNNTKLLILFMFLFTLLVASSVSATEYCYQESFNESNQTGIDGSCALNYSGNVYMTASWEDAFDGNWAGGVNHGLTNYAEINYSKPTEDIEGVVWQHIIGTATPTVNTTLPSSCVNYYTDKIRLKISTGASSRVWCYDGSWNELYEDSSGDKVYEEGIYWAIDETVTQNYYLDTYDYSSTAYQDCMDATGDDVYQCYDKGWYETEYYYQESATQINQTGIDETNDIMELIYNGSYSYVEGGMEGYVYINYSKPNNASIVGAKWLVKHGNLGKYNVTIDENCLDQTNIQLRFYSTAASFGNFRSYGQCYTGSGWVTITNISSGSYGAIGPRTPVPPTNVWDGDWNTASMYTYYATYAWTNPSLWPESYLYEDAIYWEIPIDSREFPVVAAGLQDTGLLVDNLDLTREYNTDDEYYREEFGGQNPGLLIQEDADESSIVPNYLYVNYTKPAGADRDETYWRLKHGWNGTDYLDEYITIPSACWDLNGVEGEVELRVYSSGHNVSQNESSYGQCYNGAAWELIGTNSTGAANPQSFFTADPESRLTDGNYTWGTNYRNDLGEWYWAGNIYSRILEESMHWDVDGLDPQINMWFENNESFLVDNYYVRFWANDSYENNTDEITLFTWKDEETYWNETWMAGEKWPYKVELTFSTYAPIVNTTLEQFVDFDELVTSGFGNYEFDENSVRVRNDDTDTTYETRILNFDNVTNSGMVQWFINETLAKDVYHNLSIYYSTDEFDSKSAMSTPSIQEEAFFCFEANSYFNIRYADNNYDRVAPSSMTAWAGNSASEENEYGDFADFDLDGNLDLVFMSGTNGDQSVHVYLGDDNTNPTNWTESWSEVRTGLDWGGVCTGDFNEDGYSDFVFADQGSIIKLYLNDADGNGTFTYNTTLGDVDDDTLNERNLDCGDINNDGNLDVVAGGYTSRIYHFLGHGNATFDSAVAISNSGTALNSHGILIADLNNDGCEDIVNQGATTNSEFYEGNCDGTFANSVSLDGDLLDRGQGANYWGSFTKGDFDKDGNLDIVQGTWTGRDIQLYWGNSSRLEAGGTTPSLFGDLSATSGTEYSESTGTIMGEAMECRATSSDLNGLNLTLASEVATTGTDYVEVITDGFFDIEGTELTSITPVHTSTEFTNATRTLYVGSVELPTQITIDESNKYGVQFYGTDSNIIFDKYYQGGVIFNVDYENTFDEGLVGYWAFEETSGTTLNDYKGSYDGTIVGSPILGEEGINNNAYDFDSTTVKKYVAFTSSPSITSAFTWNAWVKRKGITQYYQASPIVDLGSYAGNNGFGIWTNNDTYGWRINNDYNHYKTEATLPIDEWVMASITYDGSDIRVYKNGNLISTDTAPTPTAVTNFMRFASRNNANNEGFNGIIDEVSLWNVAKSTEDLEILYTNSRGIFYDESESSFQYSEGDSDADGLSNYEELYIYYTDPFKVDTDEGGESDYNEIQNGRDPLLHDDDVIVINSLYVTPTGPEPTDELNCNFNITNNDPYATLDVDVSWSKLLDDNQYNIIVLNESYLDESLSTGDFSNQTVSAKQVDAPIINIFTDTGCSNYCSRHAACSCSKTIPMVDPYYIKYIIANIDVGYCGSPSSKLRFNYDDSSYYEETYTEGVKTLTNPYPEKLVDNIYVYSATTGGSDCGTYYWDNPYAKVKDVQIYGPIQEDGIDPNMDIVITNNLVEEGVDRFIVQGDEIGGSSELFYSVSSPSLYESNIIMYHEFNDDDCTDIACAVDMSKYNNDVISANSIELVNDRFGNLGEYNFSDRTSVIELEDHYSNLDSLNNSMNESLRLINGGTICSKFNVNSFGIENYSYILDKSTGVNGTNGYSLYLDNRTGEETIKFVVNNENFSSASNNSININEDIVFCLTFDNEDTEFYLNGVKVSSVAQGYSPPNSNSNFFIGNNYNLNNSMNGSMDYIIIFDKVLTDLEINKILNDLSSDYVEIYDTFIRTYYDEITEINGNEYLRLLHKFYGSEPLINNFNFKYKESEDFSLYTDVNNFDHTYEDISQDMLYTTGIGTGTFTDSLENNTLYKCDITTNNQYYDTQESSRREGSFVLGELNISYPNNNYVSGEGFTTNFSTELFEGDIYCGLNSNGEEIGSFGKIISGQNFVGGLKTKFVYDLDYLEMTEGCNGQISLAPTEEYSLEVCLVDENENILQGSCKNFTSGEYTSGDTLYTNMINQSLLENGKRYKFKFTWNRIGYVSMTSNPLLDGNYDHGGYSLGTNNHKCKSYWTNTNTICSQDVDVFKYGISQTSCESSNLNTATDNETALFSDLSCTTLLTSDTIFNYYAVSELRRTYEGYYRTGGVPATIGCEEALSLKTNDDCGSCFTDSTSGGLWTSYDELWIPTSCSDGTEDDIPTNLCTYIDNSTDYSDYFVYTLNGFGEDIRFTNKIKSSGNVSWISLPEDNSWPSVDGTYIWNIECNSSNPVQSIVSDNRTFYYDLNSPIISNITTSETSYYPEIGDLFTVEADVADTFEVNQCNLYVNDNSKGYVVEDTVNVGTASDHISLEYTVSEQSIRDATINPNYFRQDEDTIFTKLSMTNGSVLVLTMYDDESSVYDTYEENPNDVFEFFDNFDGSSLNTSAWQGISVESSTVSVSNGEVTFTDDDSDNSDYYETIEKFPIHSIVEWRAKDYTAEEWPLEVAFGHGTSNTLGKIKNILTNDHYLFKAYNNGVPLEQEDFIDTDSYDIMRIDWVENSSKMYLNGTEIANLTLNIPSSDMGVAFGDLAAGGLDGEDTKGSIDWISVRQYSENFPNIVCTDNECTITADSGDFTDLQIPLTTTYTSGDLALVYYDDLTNVDWKIECVDGAGNSGETSEYSMSVKDNTNPSIILSSENSFDESNESVVSNTVENIDIEVDYFDYNLFQAYESINCDVSGLIYEWEDIDVELFDYNVISDNTYNTSYAFDVYDTTYTSTIINTTNEGFIGQEFDSFYNVSLVYYKIDTTDSNVKIQSYDGTNWNTELELARATTTHEGNVSINNKIKGLRYLFDDTTTNDVMQKSYYIKYYYDNGLTNNGANYRHSYDVDISGLPMQQCEFFASASDDHTAIEIPDYDVLKSSTGVNFETENSVNVDISYTGSLSSIDSLDYTKLDDRYTFEFDFTDSLYTRTFRVESNGGDKIYPRGNSKYPGHLVVWNSETKSGNWIDFAEFGEANKDYTINKIDDYTYDVIINSNIPLTHLAFESIGGTNVYNETWEFFIGGTLNLTSLNRYDNSTFTNYTYNIVSVDSDPVVNLTGEVGNVSQYYLTGFPEGNFTLTMTHPEFFTKVYDIEMTNETTNGTNIIDLIYDTYQAEVYVNVTDVKSHAYLSDINITAYNTNTSQNDTNEYVNGTYQTVFYLDSNVTYDFNVIKDGYINLTESHTFDYKENTSITLDQSYLMYLNIIDEKTLEPFDMVSASDPVQVEVLVFCPDSTNSIILGSDVSAIDTTNQTDYYVPVTCDYQKFKFIITYDSGVGYYRKLLVDYEDSFNLTVYLMDLVDLNYVYSAFYIDDLLGEYDNPSIWIKKLLSDSIELIQADYIDIEGKMGAYLIENDEYIIEVHSDNKPIEIIGSYGADVGEDKVISLYDVELSTGTTGFSQNVVYTIDIQNDSLNQSQVVFAYYDYENKTDSLQFNIYEDRYNGTLLYTSELFTNPEDFGHLVWPIGVYENSTLVGELVIQHQDEGEVVIAKILNKSWGLRLPLSDYVSQEFLNWFFTILLSVIAIYASMKASVMSLVIVGIGVLFVLFGWYTLSFFILGLAALVALLDFMAKRGK